MTPRPLPAGGRDLVRDLWLAGTNGLRLAGDDPAHALVQASRRLHLGRRLRAGGPPAWQALVAHAADRPGDVRTHLEAWAADSPGTTPLDRVAVEVAVNRGLVELVPDSLLSAKDRARLRLQAGDYSGAIAALPSGSRLADRIASEREAMTPGVRLPQRASVEVTPVPRRALHVLTNSLPHTQSGYTRRSQAIMQALIGRGWSVEAVTRLGYPASIGRFGVSPVETVEGVRMHRLLPWRQPATVMARLAQQADLLTELVVQFRPQVLHTTTDHTNAVVVREVATRTGLPWVYEMRGQLELTWLASRPGWAADEASASERLRLQRGRETELALAADAVVVLSEVQKDDLVDRGVPVEKITVVPNAVDEGLLTRTSTPAEARERLGLPREGAWVGAVSSVVGYEGFDVLLRAVARLRHEGRDVRCAIVGHGVSLPGLEALAAELGISEFCHFPGRQDRELALRWVEALDVVAVPRLDTPVCRVVTPLKPVEAWALGRPVVGSDLPALHEVVAAAGGRLAAPGDEAALAAALAGTLDDPTASARAHGQGRAWAAERTWQRAADRYDQLYATLGAD
ncbi:glycosyltransferase family 4 protein [Aestuariimicrobium soli]|uniref:glycosyltransferase family 4 protein n=1 Tax=Aestuariimicrobium soli TaxID=2035834 RepID=UPI003EBF8872